MYDKICRTILDSRYEDHKTGNCNYHQICGCLLGDVYPLSGTYTLSATNRYGSAEESTLVKSGINNSFPAIPYSGMSIAVDVTTSSTRTGHSSRDDATQTTNVSLTFN